MRGRSKDSRRAAFARSVQGGDEGINLALAALLFALDRHPELEVLQYLGMLDALAEGAALAVPRDADGMEALEALGRYLCDGEGYRGKPQVYASTDGCFLDRTLDRRTGLPITLSVIYLEVGWRIGLPLAGVGMPGHFIIKHVGAEAVFFDPFTGGRAFHASECEAVLGRRLGAGFAVRPEYLASVGRAAILYRMLNNLKGMYLRSRKLDRALWAIDRMLIVRPASTSDLRDRGLLYAATQNHTRACLDFEAYLSHVPSPSDAPLVQSQLDAARSRSGWLN